MYSHFLPIMERSPVAEEKEMKRRNFMAMLGACPFVGLATNTVLHFRNGSSMTLVNYYNTDWNPPQRLYGIDEEIPAEMMVSQTKDVGTINKPVEDSE